MDGVIGNEFRNHVKLRDRFHEKLKRIAARATKLRKKMTGEKDQVPMGLLIEIQMSDWVNREFDLITIEERAEAEAEAAARKSAE